MMTMERIRQLNDDLYNMMHNNKSVAEVDATQLEAIANSLQMLAKDKRETEARDKLLKAVKDLQDLRKKYPLAEINIEVCFDGVEDTVNILDYVEEMHIDV